MRSRTLLLLSTLFSFATLSGCGIVASISTYTASSTPLVHNGWTGIKAVGATTPVTQSLIDAKPASVTLSWPPMDSADGSIGSYNVYRSTNSGAQDYSAPIATGISSTDPTFTDSGVVGGSTYFYTVRPVTVGITYTPTNAFADTEIKIIVPPPNMVLVHRWAANKEMCELMGRTPDRSNDYRCPYTGLAGNGSGVGRAGTHFDIKKSFFIDAGEIGCNYTATPGACGNSYGCLFNAAPSNAVGSDGMVAFDRQQVGRCYYKSGGAWLVTSAAIDATTRVARASNSIGLPPISRVSQTMAVEMCANMTAPGFGAKKLPTRQQLILASAWPANLSDAEITDLENGKNLNVTGACNVNAGSGLTFDASVPPVNLDTIPSMTTSTSAGLLVRSGSTGTKNCVSRYGAQDLVGNLSEWGSDQFSCSSVTHICTGMTSSLDATNTDFNGYRFDGTIGPGGVTVAGALMYSSGSFSANKMLLPLGLPMLADTTLSSLWDSLIIGNIAGQLAPAKLHDDSYNISTDTQNGLRAVYSGHGWNINSSIAGRFSMDGSKQITDSTSASVGFRCVVNAE